MFVIILRYLVSPEVLEPHRPAHLVFLDKYYDNGIFMASGRQNPPFGGCILARNVSRHRLEEILKEDPFAEHRLAEYQIFEITVTKAALDFAALLNQ